MNPARYQLVIEEHGHDVVVDSFETLFQAEVNLTHLCNLGLDAYLVDSEEHLQEKPDGRD